MFEISILLSGKANETKYFQIINYSDRSLTYDLTWPGHRVIVDPYHGIVKPRTTIGVCVAIKELVEGEGLLPWSGEIHVTCDGQHKVS